MATKDKFNFSEKARLEFNAVEKDFAVCRSLVRMARYKKAFDCAHQSYINNPGNRFAIYRFAVMLGDSREWVSEAVHLKNQKKAAKILKSLLAQVKGIDERWVRIFRNEYYWFSKQPQKQYKLGIYYKKKLGKRSLYSSGVGAVSVAILKFKANKPKQGQKWAKKAIRAWEDYFTAENKYYNPHVWYAKALGLSGDLKGMEKALKKAAKLSKRPLSYQEFQLAREEVRKLTTKK